MTQRTGVRWSGLTHHLGCSYWIGLVMTGQRNMRWTRFKIRHKRWRLRIQGGARRWNLGGIGTQRIFTDDLYNGRRLRNGIDKEQKREEPERSDSWRFATLGPNIDDIRTNRRTGRDRDNGNTGTIESWVSSSSITSLSCDSSGSTSDDMNGTGRTVSKNWSAFTCNVGLAAALTKPWWR